MILDRQYAAIHRIDNPLSCTYKIVIVVVIAVEAATRGNCTIAKLKSTCQQRFVSLIALNSRPKSEGVNAPRWKSGSLERRCRQVSAGKRVWWRWSNSRPSVLRCYCYGQSCEEPMLKSQDSASRSDTNEIMAQFAILRRTGFSYRRLVPSSLLVSYNGCLLLRLRATTAPCQA